MDSFLTRIARMIPLAATGEQVADTAQRLLESAEARAGRDPRQAAELRRNALACLRVLR